MGRGGSVVYGGGGGGSGGPVVWYSKTEHLQPSMHHHWGSPCRVSILRNADVACLCRLFIPMSHVEFKKWPCRMSNLRNGPVA